MAELTPMMRQYSEVKAQYPDTILLYRLGDFYEMFFDDAVLASRELDLVLTGRDCGQEERAPMCGVPFHSADGYIAKLVAKGHKVAICEQMEEPALAKGLVRREVIRVISPGTVIESEMLSEDRNNYLACVLLEPAGAGVCFADVSTGAAQVTSLLPPAVGGKLVNELAKYLPSEVLLNPGAGSDKKLKEYLQRGQASVELLPEEAFAPEACEEEVLRHFSVHSPEELGLGAGDGLALRALGALLGYLREMQRCARSSIRSLECFSDSQFMRLDASSRRNLELCETMRGREKRGSLLWVLDQTRCGMGKRLLRDWLERPLLHLPRITKRLTAVAELLERTELRLDAQEALARLHDLERLMARVVYQSANARELLAVAQSLRELPKLQALLGDCQAELLRQLHGRMNPLQELCGLIEATLCEELPFSVREGGMIRDGYCAELDELRALERDGKGYLAAIQSAEQERTGIKKLKVGYNRVFGYYLEVSNAYRALVPDDYIRKQTLSNCERFITQELKELEAKVLGAAERIVKLEYEIFSQLRETLAEEYRRVQQSAQAAAQLDVLCSLAQVACARGYCRPEVTPGDEIEIVQGRHPVIETMLDGLPFVANDTRLNCRDCRCAVITGPNMAGKSTYMRQVALITLMAQVGSFVPAKRATIGMVDAIFTRVGASDDLASGQSTFMVEMSEVAQILQNATPQSLLIFDEIGRGTSTFDGMSIARAVLEHAADSKRLGAKTLFATHYHELTELEGTVPGLRNFAVAVKKRGDEIIFLRRIIHGAADRSYGIEVARLAGLPEAVLRRAKQVLREMERGDRAPEQPAPQGDMAAEPPLQSGLRKELLQELCRMDPDAITPIEALTILHHLAKRAKEMV